MFNCSSFVTSCVVIRCRVFIPYSCRYWFCFLSYIIFLFIYLFICNFVLFILILVLLLLFTLSRPNLQPIFRLIFGPSSGPTRTHYSVHFSVNSQANVGPKSGQNRRGPFSRPQPQPAGFSPAGHYPGYAPSPRAACSFLPTSSCFLLSRMTAHLLPCPQTVSCLGKPVGLSYHVCPLQSHLLAHAEPAMAMFQP